MTGLLAATTVSGQAAFSSTGEVLRDIARGGVSGALVGIVVGGLDGRWSIVNVLYEDREFAIE